MAAGFGLNGANFLAGGVNQLGQNLTTNTVPVQNAVKCPSCNNDVVQGSKFCNHCGSQLQQVKFCTSCGNKLNLQDKFCSVCGGRC